MGLNCVIKTTSLKDEINIHDHKIITNSILSDPIKEEFSPKKI